MRLLRFSANLGFLFTEHTLPDAIGAAAKAGFDAVELHWPYDTPAGDVAAALGQASLPVLGLNTRRGDVAAGEFGLSALTGREADARKAIEEAVTYAAAIGAGNIHVMAGRAEGDKARATFIGNLRHAADLAQEHAISILIEPLNGKDVPGYFLTSCDAASAIIDAAGRANIRIMFDCYHVAMQGGDIVETYRRHRDAIGHVQFAAVPDRGEPDRGDIDYAAVLPALSAEGHDGFFGAEYRPRTGTEAGLGWMRAFSA